MKDLQNGCPPPFHAQRLTQQAGGGDDREEDLRSLRSLIRGPAELGVKRGTYEMAVRRRFCLLTARRGDKQGEDRRSLRSREEPTSDGLLRFISSRLASTNKVAIGDQGKNLRGFLCPSWPPVGQMQAGANLQVM